MSVLREQPVPALTCASRAPRPLGVPAMTAPDRHAVHASFSLERHHDLGHFLHLEARLALAHRHVVIRELASARTRLSVPGSRPHSADRAGNPRPAGARAGR